MGRHDQLPTIPCPRGRIAVYVDRPNRETIEVEVEARQALGRACADRGLAGKEVRCRLIGQVEQIMLHVVSAVPIEREVWIARPGCSWLELPPLMATRRS